MFLYFVTAGDPIVLSLGVARQCTLILKNAILEDDHVKMQHYANDIIFLDHIQQKDCRPSQQYPIAFQCIEFLKENLANEITLDTLSRHFYLSKQWLTRLLKEETGKTPIEYLNIIRIRNAQDLLKYTDLPIAEIASKCGFENVYYFSNSFKKRVSVSPKEYRKRLQL